VVPPNGETYFEGTEMIDPHHLDELAHRLSEALPEDFNLLRSDVQKNLRAALQAALRRMDLVTREEFDVQAALLARTREKLEALEREVAALEGSRKRGKKSPE
jgi:BMFP domain-containing protein YqiC